MGKLLLIQTLQSELTTPLTHYTMRHCHTQNVGQQSTSNETV